MRFSTSFFTITLNHYTQCSRADSHTTKFIVRFIAVIIVELESIKSQVFFLQIKQR